MTRAIQKYLWENDRNVSVTITADSVRFNEFYNPANASITETSGRPIYTMMREMSVSQNIVLPYDKWQTARSTASMLFRDFGAKYYVYKDAPHGMPGNIIVTREI